MKNIVFVFVLLAIGFSSCQSNKEAEVFVGEWVDKKNPTHKWKIEKSGSSFIGTRTGEVDFYKETSTETWKVNAKNALIQLTNKAKGGTSLTFINGKDEVMRHPPGVVYKRVK